MSPQPHPTTYWRYEEQKLGNVVSGLKDGAGFEYYEYYDDETVDLVYNQICAEPCGKFFKICKLVVLF